MRDILVVIFTVCFATVVYYMASHGKLSVLNVNVISSISDKHIRRLEHVVGYAPKHWECPKRLVPKSLGDLSQLMSSVKHSDSQTAQKCNVDGLRISIVGSYIIVNGNLYKVGDRLPRGIVVDSIVDDVVCFRCPSGSISNSIKCVRP